MTEFIVTRFSADSNFCVDSNDCTISIFCAQKTKQVMEKHFDRVLLKIEQKQVLQQLESLSPQ